MATSKDRFWPNLLTNFGGTAVAGVVQILVMPAYLAILGEKSFGLVGFLISVELLLRPLDTGLSTGVTREIAQRLEMDKGKADIPSLVWSLLHTYLVGALLIWGVGYLSAPWIATEWFHADGMEPERIQTALRIFLAAGAIRLVSFLFVGVMRGLQEQVVQNLVTGSMNLLRGLGSIAVLLLVSPTIEAMVWFILLVSVIEVGLLGWVVWQRIQVRAPGPIGWRFDLLRSVGKFAVHISISSIFAAGLKQVDKILVTRYLPLEQVGYYTAASMLTLGIVTLLSSPVFMAVYPQISAALVDDGREKVVRAFRRGGRLVAWMVTPLAFAFIVFPETLLWLWTQNVEMARTVGVATQLLALATLFNSAMQIPLTLQLGAGLSYIPMVTNGLGLLLVTPLLFWTVPNWGLSGAAVSWLSFNVVYFLVIPHIVFPKVFMGLYRREMRHWYLNTLGPPVLLGALLFGTAGWVVQELPFPDLGQVLAGVVAATLYMAVMLLLFREELLGLLRDRRAKNAAR